MSLRQNNPILYILAEPLQISAEAIKAVYQQYLDPGGIGFLTLDAKKPPEDVFEELREMHTAFLTKPYIYYGEIKVNYILDGDSQESLNLPDVKSELEDYLKYLYPGGIVTDIFVLVNDPTLPLWESCRSQVIEQLQEIQNEQCMVYILSTVNSKNMFLTKDHSHSVFPIAYMGLVKDCVPQRSQRYFQEDCFKNGGRFLTLGYLRIQAPIEKIKKILALRLMEILHAKESTPSPFTWEGESKPAPYGEDLLGLMVSGTASQSNLNNGQVLDAFFGKRLDSFFEMSYVAPQSGLLTKFSEYLTKTTSHEQTKPQGPLFNTLKKLQSKNAEDINALESEQKRWLAEQSGAGTKALSLVLKISDRPYKLAEKYLNYKWKKQQLTQTCTALEEAFLLLEDRHTYLQQQQEGLSKWAIELNRELEDIENDLFLSRPGAVEFYNDILIGMGDIPSSQNALQNYVDDIVIQANILQGGIEKHLLALLKHDGSIRTDNDAYNYIYNWIAQNKVFNILLKTGFTALHCETNIFMGRQLGIEEQTVNKINFFYENNGNSIDVLYQGGAFNKEDLYYEDRQISTER